MPVLKPGNNPPAQSKPSIADDHVQTGPSRAVPLVPQMRQEPSARPSGMPASNAKVEAITSGVEDMKIGIPSDGVSNQAPVEKSSFEKAPPVPQFRQEPSARPNGMPARYAKVEAIASGVEDMKIDIAFDGVSNQAAATKSYFEKALEEMEIDDLLDNASASIEIDNFVWPKHDPFGHNRK